MGQWHLAKLSEQAFERLGDRETLWFEGRWYNSGELRERSHRLAQGLVELGLQPSDRVVVMLPNGPDVPMVYSALWRAGAAITPAMFLLPPDEVKRIITDSEVRAVITSVEFLATIRAAAEGAENLKWIISTGPETDGVISISSLEDSDPGEIVDVPDDSLAALMYTGGTTGRSKGVMLSHENLAFCGQSSYEASYIPELNMGMTALPLSHAFGLIVTVTGFYAREPGKAILMGWFDASRWLEHVEEFKVQRAAAVPSMIQILLGQSLQEYDLSSWLYVTVGAAPLARETIEEFERRVPSCKILEGYGCTESGAVITVNRAGNRKVGSVGQPISGYELKIVDGDGNEVAVGERGEVCCRSRGVMQGYWKDPELTAETLKGGWLHTGDIGTLDDDGFLCIVDRQKDLIIRGGFNVFPRDVEDVLLEHPAVEVAGVVGKPDPTYGEEVVAFISLRPGARATPEELIEHCKQKVAGHKYPREVRMVGYVPLTPVGKVDRKALRQML